MNDNHVVINLPSDDRWLPFAHNSLLQYGKMVGFSERLDEMLTSAVMEACEELFRKAAQVNVTDGVSLCLDFKGEAVVVDIEYSARIPLNPHETEDYEVPDAETDLEDLEMETLWLHMIKRRMDRVRFMVRGSRHVLRMIKYRRDAGKEKQSWVMAIKPELHKDLVLHLEDTESEHPSSVLQNPGGGVLKLGPSETFVIQNINGDTTFHDIYMAHIDRMDAYYMLIDYTGIPNLREKSFRFLKRKTFGWLGFGSDKDTKVTIRERRIFWWYGVLAALMTVFFLAIPILRLRYLLRADSLYGGKLFIALLIVALLIARLASMAFSMVKSIRYREYKIQ